MVHWISANSSLEFPSFDLSQKVKLVVEEESDSSSLQVKTVFNKEFLTQTGFKIHLLANRRYRWKVESSAQIEKMVEVAIARKPRAAFEAYVPEAEA